MPDRLYDAIVRAIAERLDEDMFERCAVDLLHENYYPTLRPVEGGNDAGMDGLGELGDGTPFFLASTLSEDARGNLERNVRSYVDAGGDRRVVVFATSRPVSGRRRVEFASLLQEQFGVRLAEVHDRADFVQMLYRSPRWRKELLGIPAQARALTRLPVTRRPTLAIPLVGRDEDLERLRALSGDLALIGKPGVGKTYLLEKLMEEDWGLFDDGWDVPALEDTIRELQPARVVVDDAHLKGDRLAVLRRLRREMGASFGIVGVSWPGQTDEVVALLPGAPTFEVRELDRDQILQVVTEVGIAGPRDLQALLVHQAHGRAGLAVTLAHACLSGRIDEVARGYALLADVVGWFTRSLGKESRHVLGILALAGERGATLAQVAGALGLDKVRVSELVRGLASGGTIDEAGRAGQAFRLRVQPEAFRYALVRDVFFGGPGSLDVSDAVTHLEHPSDGVLPLIGAIHRGAAVDRAFLRGLVDWNDSEAATTYALLGPSEIEAALASAPQHRASIARAAYEAGVRPEVALAVLMDRAVGDTRDELNTPEHPLRIVGDHLQRPEATVEERALAVAVADQWLRRGGAAEVGFRVMMHAVHPGARDMYADPGLGRTVTIREAALPVAVIRQLGELWTTILDILEREGAGSPRVILQTLHSWVYPGTLALGRGVDDETKAAVHEVAVSVISRLSGILQNRPGALRQLRDYVTRARFDVTVDVPAEFDTLFPADWDGEDVPGGYQRWEQATGDAVRTLAASWGRLPEEEIAARIATADAEALAAGITWPRLTPLLAEVLADGTDRPDRLLAALRAVGAAGDVLLPVVQGLVIVRPDGWEAQLEGLLDDDNVFGVALIATLRTPVGARLKDHVIKRVTPAHAGLVDLVVIRDEADIDTLERLLHAPEAAVARATALALAKGAGDARLGQLPEAVRKRWRQVILESPADDYWYSVVLPRDPELFAEWLRGWFGRLHANPSHLEALPHHLEEAIPKLPVALRIELIRTMPSDVEPFLVQEAVTGLVSGDVEAAVALFERQDLEDLHWTALRSGPDEAWMRRALKALDMGWEPARVVAPTVFSESGWMGEESAHWQRKIDAFASLRHGAESGDPRREQIIAAGVEYFERQRAAAAERERRERTFG